MVPDRPTLVAAPAFLPLSERPSTIICTATSNLIHLIKDQYRRTAIEGGLEPMSQLDSLIV